MKQDYFTRDKGKLISRKVGDEVRTTKSQVFRKALNKLKK